MSFKIFNFVCNSDSNVRIEIVGLNAVLFFLTILYTCSTSELLWGISAMSIIILQGFENARDPVKGSFIWLIRCQATSILLQEVIDSEKSVTL